MKTFKDRQNRTWLIEINVALAKKVRALTGVDLYRLVDNDFANLQELLRDQITLVDVIYVLCKDQADAQKMTDENFGAGLAGETVTRAAEAFMDAYIDFSQDPRAAAVLRSLTTKGLAAVDAQMTEAEKIADWVTVEMLVQDAKEPGFLAKKLNERLTTSPESSASTPAPSLSPR